MTAHYIAMKARKALRKDTGVTLSHSQLRELVGYGLFDLLAPHEIEELCPAKTAPISSETTGSTGGAMDVRRSGKSPTPSNDQSFIAALTAKA